MYLSDLLNYDIKHLRKSGKIDCKFPKPGALVTLGGSTNPQHIYEILKIVKGGNIVVWESKNGVVSTVSLREVKLVDTRFIEDARKKKTKEWLNIQILGTPLRRKRYLLKYLNKVLPKIYEEKYFDIITKDQNNNVTLIIHYPTLTIRNSAGQSHNITDFFVKFTFCTNDGLYLDNPSYTRSSFTEEDILSGGSLYIHSHLNSNQPCRWSANFCYGATILGSTLHEFGLKLDLKKFSTFLINLEDTLKWESLEGGPYYRISSLGQGETSSSGYIAENSCTDDYAYMYLIKELRRLNSFPAFQYQLGDIKVPYKHRLHKIVTDGYLEYCKDRQTPQLFEFDEESMRSKSTVGDGLIQRKKQIEDSSNFFFVFKGREIRPKFTITTKPEDNGEKLCHYEFYNKVINKLESNLKSSIVLKTLNNE